MFREVLEAARLGACVYTLEDADDDASLTLALRESPPRRACSARIFSTCLGARMLQVVPSVPRERMHAYAQVCRDRTRARVRRASVSAADDREADACSASARVPVLERGVAILFENLTREKRSEAETRTLNKFLDSIIENIPAMVFVKDARDLRFERFNRAGEELLGSVARTR